MRILPPQGATFVADVDVGTVLNDHYRLVRLVGRGGMGVVYEAEDVKLPGRRVAVKLLPPEMAGNKAAILRLQREASAICALDHPAIVRLIELNADGDCHYLVMEYLDGENLENHVAAQGGPLALDEVLAIARHVGSGLAYAHARNVIHRDLKPANLVFTSGHDGHVAKVTDFGIAFQIRDSMIRLTGHEGAGTVPYMAPEQLRGKRATAASDQYSFAVTLYELLAGAAPFTGAALAHQIEHGEAEPVDGVPEHVNSALMRALSKAPEERFGDVLEFVSALAGPVVVAGEPRVGQVWRNSIGMEFLWVPPGEFDMGGSDPKADSDEKPVHRVRIARGFWLGKFPVTQDEWQAVMGENPSNFKGDGRLPVEQVSWRDCHDFLRKLASKDGHVYRLPSEAQWEYACRAGTTAERYGDLDGVAWYYGNAGTGTRAVGAKCPNAWGFYDVLGNVWEWCQDTWHFSFTCGYAGAPMDGGAWDGGDGSRLVRGGAWNALARYVRAAHRNHLDSGGKFSYVGVRVVALPRNP